MYGGLWRIKRKLPTREKKKLIRYVHFVDSIMDYSIMQLMLSLSHIRYQIKSVASTHRTK